MHNSVSLCPLTGADIIGKGGFGKGREEMVSNSVNSNYSSFAVVFNESIVSFDLIEKKIVLYSRKMLQYMLRTKLLTKLLYITTGTMLRGARGFVYREAIT